MDRRAGRVALVTGAGQGIGRGIALVFAREGARVCVAELKEHRAERTAQEIRAAGAEALALVADVGRREDVERVVAETVRRWGSVDVLVNNAHGFGARAPLADIPDEQTELSWTSGVDGTWRAMCAARPHTAARTSDSPTRDLVAGRESGSERVACGGWCERRAAAGKSRRDKR